MRDQHPLKTTRVETGDFLVPVLNLCEECMTAWQAASDEDAKEAFLDRVTLVCGKCWDCWKRTNAL